MQSKQSATDPVKRAARPQVDVRTRGIRRAVDPRTIRRRAEKLLLALGLPDAELSILLCTDDLIAELNAEYRGIDRSTDVLSFPLDEAPDTGGGHRMLGDIVVSIDTARVQALRHRHRLLDELTFLLVHGLLHLIGYDHRTDADADRMDRRARELLVPFEPARETTRTQRDS
jgi:probable rRNA maturation factor